MENAMKEYFKKAKAVRYFVGMIDSGTIRLYDFPEVELQKIIDFSECQTLRKDKRTEARKYHDGKKQKKHYRINKTNFRKAICGLYGDTGRKNPYYVGEISLADFTKWEEEVFCPRFGCVLSLKQVGKHYTHGDSFEFWAWCFLGGDENNWFKNCRAYDRGTDFDVYEIKSVIWGDASFSPRVNAVI